MNSSLASDPAEVRDSAPPPLRDNPVCHVERESARTPGAAGPVVIVSLKQTQHPGHTTAEFAPLGRGLVPPSRCAMVAAELGCAGQSSPARAAVQLGGANESEDSGASLALWRGPCIRRVRYRSEPRSNGRGPNAKYLSARPDVRDRAGQVRRGAARGQ